MNTLVLLSVVVIAALIGGLAFYLAVLGSQLARVADKLEECADLVWEIKHNADVIEPGLERISRTGGTIAGALPLLYSMAEGIVVGATYEPAIPAEPEAVRPASGTRRSRFLDSVGYRPHG
ncbi:MAG: hypothetical protein WD576_00270 [Nitriliruptoraceae bacterium]